MPRRTYHAQGHPQLCITALPPSCIAWRRYLSLIIATVIFLDASLRTLPCYSLAVQMGSDFKHRE